MTTTCSTQVTALGAFSMVDNVLMQLAAGSHLFEQGWSGSVYIGPRSSSSALGAQRGPPARVAPAVRMTALWRTSPNFIAPPGMDHRALKLGRCNRDSGLGRPGHSGRGQHERFRPRGVSDPARSRCLQTEASRRRGRCVCASFQSAATGRMQDPSRPTPASLAGEAGYGPWRNAYRYPASRISSISRRRPLSGSKA